MNQIHETIKMTGAEVVTFFFDKIGKHRAAGDNVYFRGERINKMDWPARKLFLKSGEVIAFHPLKNGTTAAAILKVFEGALEVAYGERASFFEAFQKQQNKNGINRAAQS